MKFTVSNDPNEIQSVIRKKESIGECIVWQTQEKSRTVQTINEVSVDNLRKVLRFKLDQGAAQDLDPSLIVYAKLSFRSTIFKGDLLGQSGDYVFVNIPDEVQFEELREFPRFKFALEENKNVTLSINSDLLSNSLYSLKVKLQDISEAGLGFLLSYANHELIGKNDLFMTQLGDLELDHRIGTKIIYADRFAYKDNGSKIQCLKVGARLQNQISKELIEAFIRKEEGFDHSKIGFLGLEYEFQNSLHYQMDTMLKHLKKRNDFFSALEQTTITSKQIKEHEYFPKHIRLLAKVSCGLAKILGLDNKKVINQLIYMSFVHDVAFYATPKLSLIKNLDHFEKIKGELTAQEIDLFLNAPKIAFDYAFYDRFAPKGVESALLQTKELPSGSGFPNKIQSDAFSPLAAIFVVAHDLTDYILEHKSWSYYNYLLDYSEKFQGGIFDEIFLQLEKSRQSEAV